MQQKLDTAVQAAYKAGELLRSHFRSSFGVREKSPANLVTELDTRSEQLILELLGTAFPHIPALTEEQPPGSVTAAGERWVIDPLDGTTNYAHGYPCFGVSIALEQAGKTVLGVVYDVMQDQMYTAVAGQGAFVNGSSICVSQTVSLNQALLASGFPYTAWTDPDDNSAEWARLLKKVVSLRSDGSAALDLCRVACGSLDGYWELDLEAWDTAAGALIVTEAGGQVTLVDGGAFTPYRRSVLATNGKIHAVMLRELRGR